MKLVAGLFRDPEQARRVLDELREAGFGDTTRAVSSPTSAAEIVASAGAIGTSPREDGFMDFGAILNGQAGGGFTASEVRAYEARVAQGDVLVAVDAPDGRAAAAEEILRRGGAERVAPGTIRD